MNDKKRLYRRCANCAKTFPVRRESDPHYAFYKSAKDQTIFVSWRANAFDAEIKGDMTPYWFCDECARWLYSET